METLKVSDLMTTRVVSLRPHDNLETLQDLMFEKGIRHVPVVDDERSVVGLVTHRDFLRRALYATESLPLSATRDFLRTMKVSDVMVTGVETISPDAELEEAGRLILDSKFGCLPVTEGTHLVGILTEADFVRFVADEQARHREESRAAG